VDHPRTSNPIGLLAGLGATWPATVAAEIGPCQPLLSCLDALASGDEIVWCGYTSPSDLMLQWWQHQHTATLSALLHQWEQEVHAILYAKGKHPNQLRLIHLGRLTTPALAQLLRLSTSALDELPVPGSSKLQEASSALTLYLHRRTDLLDLYAQLEDQADLLGREPEFRWSEGNVCDVNLNKILLESAETSRLLCTLEKRCKESEEELKHVLRQRDQAQKELKEQSIEQQNTQDRCKNAEEEAELILEQLHQVQEELERQFLDARAASQHCQELEQELHKIKNELEHLQSEACYLFVNSTPSDELNPTNTTMIRELIKHAVSHES
jgi:hypothetical protein